MTTGSNFWGIIIAGSGGVFVLVGLLMELEREGYKSISGFRRAKSRKFWGEWMVIIGIVIEIGLAGFAAADEWQNKPEHQPIKAITARVFLEIQGTNFNESVLSQQSYKYIIRTDAACSFFSEKLHLASLGCEKFVSFAIRNPELSDPSDRSPNERIYSMSFSWSSDIAGNPRPDISDWIAGKNASLERLEKEMVGVTIAVPGMRGGMKIVRGSCVILFNGSIERKFSIPEYTSDLTLECLPTKN